MRRVLLVCCVTAAFGVLAAGASAAPITHYHAKLGKTVVAKGGKQRKDASGRMHARRLPVTDTLLGANGTLGQLKRHVSFNMDPSTGASVAWCDFTLTLKNVGKFSGRCAGTLMKGYFSGIRTAKSIWGTYKLVAGGTPGVGPHTLDFWVAGLDG